MEKKATKPVAHIEVENLEAAIWLNDTKEGPMLNFTLQRVYRVNGERRRSNSFGKRDRENLSRLVALASEYVAVHEPTEFGASITVEVDAPEAEAQNI